MALIKHHPEAQRDLANLHALRKSRSARFAHSASVDKTPAVGVTTA